MYICTYVLRSYYLSLIPFHNKKIQKTMYFYKCPYNAQQYLYHTCTVPVPYLYMFEIWESWVFVKIHCFLVCFYYGGPGLRDRSRQ